MNFLIHPIESWEPNTCYDEDEKETCENLNLHHLQYEWHYKTGAKNWSISFSNTIHFESMSIHISTIRGKKHESNVSFLGRVEVKVVMEVVVIVRTIPLSLALETFLLYLRCHDSWNRSIVWAFPTPPSLSFKLTTATYSVEKHHYFCSKIHEL